MYRKIKNVSFIHIKSVAPIFPIAKQELRRYNYANKDYDFREVLIYENSSRSNRGQRQHLRPAAD